MSNATATYPLNAQSSDYLGNLARAARAFVAALLAVKPAAETPMSDAERLRTRKHLLSLASSFDASLPNQAAELRYFAGQA